MPNVRTVEEERSLGAREAGDVEVLVCSTGRENAVLEEKLRIVRSFWDAGIPTDYILVPPYLSLSHRERRQS